MAQGHLCIHLIFYMIAYALPYMETRYNRPIDQADEKFNVAIVMQEKCINLMRQGHLASFFVISISMILKKFERFNLGQLLLVVFLPFTQGYPLTFGLYTFSYYQPEMIADLADPNVVPSRFTAMLYLEVTYFFMWLLAISWALAFFYFSKF
tara:strand:- start:88 stop:543 length:456 start_codon:yes stop_codon:yes gene_type:complete